MFNHFPGTALLPLGGRVENPRLPALARLSASAFALAPTPRWLAWADERAEHVLAGEHDRGVAIAGVDELTGKGWKPYDVVDGVALIPVQGLLLPSLGWIGSSWATGYAELGWQVDIALEDEEVRGIALWIDSGGGLVDGLHALGIKLRAARETKPVAAIVDEVACSAAYWIAVQAQSIAAPQLGGVGSIGVVAIHWDDSVFWREKLGMNPTLIFSGAHKVDGNPFEPLPDEVRKSFQATMDEFREVFAEEVAAGRSGAIDKAQVLATEARIYEGRSAMAEALSLGLVDALATADEALAAFAGSLAAASG